MPTNLTEVDDFTTPVVVPNDGEGVTAASVVQFAQPLANRTKNLNGIIKTSGVYRHKTVADLTALKAVTGMADHDFRYLDGVGLYFFDSTTTPVGDTLPTIIKPGSGSGQWLLSFIGLFGTTGGLATLNGSNKVIQAVPNRLVQMLKSTDATGVGGSGAIVFTETSSSYTAVTGSQGYVDITGANVGDLLNVQVHYGMSVVGSTGGYVRVEVNDNHGLSPVLDPHLESEAYTEQTISAGNPIYIARHILHTVAASGTSRVRFALKCSGTSVNIRTPISMIVSHWRP